MNTQRKRPVSVESVTRAEFEALSRRIADVEDALALRGAATTFDENDTLPLVSVKRIAAGEHPLRVWRIRRNLTLSALAKRAGVGVGYLSEIETGKKPGSVRTFRELAKTLGVDIDDLVAVPRRT